MNFLNLILIVYVLDFLGYVFDLFYRILYILIGVFGLGFDDYNFNFVIRIEEIGHILTFWHVKDALLDSRDRELLFGSITPACLSNELQIDAQGSIGQIRDSRIRFNCSDKLDSPIGINLDSYLLVMLLPFVVIVLDVHCII